MERIKTLSLLSGILGFVVVALGAWTRLADAGLGCPDWPGCYGFVTIPVSPEEIDIANSKFPDTPYEVAKAIPEVVHRYFAAALGFFIVCIAYLAVRSKDVPTNIRNLSIFLLVAASVSLDQSGAARPLVQLSQSPARGGLTM